MELSIDRTNVGIVADEISNARDSYIKDLSAAAVSALESKRRSLKLSLEDFYNKLLGSSLNYRTIKKILAGELLVPPEILYSFCFVFGYDINTFREISALLKANASFDDYQQIGAVIESLGRGGVLQLADAVRSACTEADLYTRKACSEVLTAFAEKLDYQNASSMDDCQQLLEKAVSKGSDIRSGKDLADTFPTRVRASNR